MPVKKFSMLIHKWLGLVLSLWLLLITLTGTVLLYKNDLLEWQYPQLDGRSIASQEQALDTLALDVVQAKARFSFVPSELHPWVETIDEAGARHYFSNSGELLVSREKYSDWISWFVEFHHHLLLDDLGEELQGVFGLLTLLVLITGFIKWWPKGRWQKRDLSVTFSRPGKKRWGQTLWQSHRTLGVTLLLPMFLLVLTGVGMIYYQAFNTGLNAMFPQQAQTVVDYQPIIDAQNKKAENLGDDFKTRVLEAKKIMPGMQPTMLYHDRDGIRFKQPEEWHPNGRSSIAFEADSSKVTKIIDYRNETVGTQLSQKIYPLHIASVGGITYFSLVVISGVALIWITVSGFWFWLWCRGKKKLAQQKRKRV